MASIHGLSRYLQQQALINKLRSMMIQAGLNYVMADKMARFTAVCFYPN